MRPKTLKAEFNVHPVSNHQFAFGASARLIAGNDPPIWLTHHLERWAPSLMIDNGVHNQQPQRAEVIKELTLALDKARFLRNLTARVAFVEFLEMREGNTSFDIQTFASSLQDFEQRCHFALSSPSLIGKSGKTKAGAGKALPPNASSPRSFCAAIILESWAYFHNGKYPAASNRKLAAAANRYWEECIGTPTGWGSSRLGGWRPYFQEASELPLAEIRKELRRHVLISAERSSRTTLQEIDP